ncbi:helix-turn-helix transcriptional regulator [Reichenbachiella sp.]|uniref:helix-turn-helix transcriptional regulator n=1 Tax=Reichenbachiella sp. TaxID=2184521 RepID=UPI003B5ABC78
MKGSNLGEFQEIVLLSILILDEEAYGLKIQQELSTRLKRTLSRGALHTALTRLEEKGFIDSRTGGATAERGGRRKRYYSLTNSGKESLQQARALREEMWSQVPEVQLVMISNNLPSRFAKFFEWFCRAELFEELQGDLEEAFEEKYTNSWRV